MERVSAAGSPSALDEDVLQPCRAVAQMQQRTSELAVSFFRAVVTSIAALALWLAGWSRSSERLVAPRAPS